MRESKNSDCLPERDEFELAGDLGRRSARQRGPSLSQHVEQVRILTPDKDVGQCLHGDRVVQVDRREEKVLNEAVFRA
jgi:hypothetical protein